MFLIRFLIRLVVLPFRVAFATIRIALRTGVRVALLPGRLSGRALGLVGFKALLLFVVGVAVGLLAAPTSGRELIAKLAKMLDKGTTTDTDLAAKVGFELAHAPRTWHFEQPVITVIDRRVRLRGTVPSSDARAELARVAAAVPGVAGVDNELQVVEASSDDAPSATTD